ncbi:MAG: MFS transporter [Gallionellales bacterium RIFCSPHIGHO2_02_FULL_57_16]|nr:MAG: MFS transporter [Gallionellales bacterium RIFCSPHIGHO2_02_FULL_57_16]
MTKHKLPGAVIAIGLVSFFNDLASEMVTPFIPILIATVLGAGPVILGLVEGVADAAASFLKLWAGRYSDCKHGRRKQLMVFGYGLSNLARPLLALVSSWGALLLLRSLDRAGKGLRNAPRDALLADSAHADIHGFAYGFHRAMDNAGALGGTLLAVAALSWLNWSVSEGILWSALPGVLVLLVLIFGVHEAPRPEIRQQMPQAPLAWAALSHDMRRYLLVLVLFTFARVSESFILLRGNELGMSVVQLLLLWAVLSLTKSGASLLGGRMADAFGRRRLTMISWSGYAAGFIALGLAEQGGTLWACTLLYGLLAGLGEGSERALISLYADERERGTAFGWYHLAVGMSAIPAGVLFGTIWHYWNAGAAFMFAGALALLCALLLRFWNLRDSPDVEN